MNPYVRGYRRAARHLLALGLLPAPCRDEMRILWANSPEDRQLVAYIAEHLGDDILTDAEMIEKGKAVDKVPGAALVAVHHTRKMAAEDWLDTVSGTQGIAGSADYILVLQRKRKSDEGILAVTGRDVAEREIAVKK